MDDGADAPSPISSIQDSNRPNYDSHESLGFHETRRRTYSLANSLSQPEPMPPSMESQRANDSFLSGLAMSSEPASNAAADLSMTSIALADDDDPRRSPNTTRILQRALESNPKWNTGLEHFTDFPPRGVRHADYNKYVDELPDDTSAYTQVLIWCLVRRIEHLKKAPPERLRLSLLLVNVLQNLQHKLQSGLTVPSVASAQPLKLKPRMTNPSNEWYSVVRDRLRTAYDKIHETTHESYQIAGQFEKLSSVDSPAPADIQVSDPENLDGKVTKSVTEVQTTIEDILKSITTLDGATLQSRETVYEELDRRASKKISHLEDPISILNDTALSKDDTH